MIDGAEPWRIFSSVYLLLVAPGLAVLGGIVLSILPVVIVYIFGQRALIEGIMTGGLKG